MIGFGFGPQKLPEHSTWIGAVASGLSEAAGHVWDQSGVLVRGGFQAKNLDGKKEFLEVPRSLVLKGMAGSIGADVHRHTLSVNDPQAFQRWNAAVAKYQAGDQEAFKAIQGTCSNPYGSEK